MQFMHDGQQRRLRAALQETHVQARYLGGSGQRVTEDVEADGTGKGAGHAQARHHARHVPGRAAHLAAPGIRASAQHIRQRFAG